MSTDHRPNPTVLIIFGAGGDLTWRKLIPALFNLSIDQWLPEQFAILGVDIKPMSKEEFRNHLYQGVSQFSRRGKPMDQEWNDFVKSIDYMPADFTNAAAYTILAKHLGAYCHNVAQKLHISIVDSQGNTQQVFAQLIAALKTQDYDKSNEVASYPVKLRQHIQELNMFHATLTDQERKEFIVFLDALNR